MCRGGGIFICARSGSCEAVVQTENWLCRVVWRIRRDVKYYRCERCVMCESGAGNVKYLLMTCGEFERDRWALVDKVSRIVGAGEWLEKYGRVCKEGKVVLLLGKGVE